ncbi:hypothetical protein PMAYCL1PPCAC_33061, partial [Pristionchus mayeri]
AIPLLMQFFEVRLGHVRIYVGPDSLFPIRLRFVDDESEADGADENVHGEYVGGHGSDDIPSVRRLAVVPPPDRVCAW